MSEDTIQNYDFHMVDSVILTRAKEPKYYAGTIGKGDNQRAVWSHDKKQARSIDADRIHLYEEKIGEELIPLWPYAR